jgi:metal-responsive CopG/Arc/MetJ family transcriptional regulator
MKTLQLTVEEKLLQDIDRVVKMLHTSRAVFARRALRAELTRIKGREMDRRHREGYAKQPARKGEFSAWEAEQVWPE